MYEGVCVCVKSWMTRASFYQFCCDFRVRYILQVTLLLLTLNGLSDSADYTIFMTWRGLLLADRLHFAFAGPWYVTAYIWLKPDSKSSLLHSSQWRSTPGRPVCFSRLSRNMLRSTPPRSSDGGVFFPVFHCPSSLVRIRFQSWKISKGRLEPGRACQFQRPFPLFWFRNK